MWTLGVNTSHDGAICLMKNDQIILHLQEERISHKKHDKEIIYLLDLISKYTKHLDLVAYTHLYNKQTDFGTYYKLFSKNGIVVKKYINLSEYHHSLHALCAFYNSGFDDAACVVVDGAGSDFEFGKENESIFIMSFPVDYECLYKSVIGYGIDTIDNKNHPFVDPVSKIGAGMIYSGVTEYLGWDGLECGKTMGLSSYGKEDENIKIMLSESGGNENLFNLWDFNQFQHVGARMKQYEYLSHYKDKKDLERKKQNLCYALQKQFEQYMLQLIYKAISITNKKNILLTGGCALNCVNNYRLLKNLPPDIKLYVEPISDDSGTAMGAAKMAYYQNERKKYIPKYKKTNIKNLYFGQPIKYEYNLYEWEIQSDCSFKDAAQLIADGNIVALCQGRSEAGPRALGNRSILFDPRNPNGKDIVNRVKKREYFRPFAGTVLLEHAKEWFDMDKLEESPFMMYAVDVLESKRNLIPAITHVDGTCRIQTLTEEQNLNYYTLIKEFYNLTGVPILFNTSFNLAGDTMVEDMDDAFKTMRCSEIQYLILPEISSMIYFPNEKNIC